MFYWFPVDDSTNFKYVISRLNAVFNVKKKKIKPKSLLLFLLREGQGVNIIQASDDISIH